jgi:organic hydroperoxide reductase OsmC/OhrA
MAYAGSEDGVHVWRSTASWAGSTGAGYEAYGRAHRVTSRPSTAELDLANDPSLGGDAALLDPEQLVLLAASSCQLLSFLAVAARARIDVREYEDEGEARMASDAPPRLASITLRPRITAVGTTVERIAHWTEVAHRQCYISNSLSTPVTVVPEVVILDEVGSAR